MITGPSPDAPATTAPATAAPLPGGIIAREEHFAATTIAAALTELGFGGRPVDLRPVPFAGTWGIASSVCFATASDVVMRDLDATGALEGLSKKDAKKLAADAVRTRSQELATAVAAHLEATGRFARIDAVNGFINIYFDANAVARRLIGEVLDQGDDYGNGDAKPELIMVEHSQPNTHKAFHVGHLRNSCLGISISHILRAAGYRVQDANYIGDIGMHVIKCLWCYENFHQGEEPAAPDAKGRWLGDVYAESDARLNYREEVLSFLQLLSQEDPIFIAAIDRMLKFLWRKGTEGEDIAYLLGRITHAQPIKEEMLREDDVIQKFWPIIGEQLVDQVDNPNSAIGIEGQPEPTMTPHERLARWAALNEHIDDWWPHGARWREDVRETFQRWERQEPPLVTLWAETKAWSMADFRRIFDELGARFDVWLFESEVEEEGKVIVRDLLTSGLAEISDGLPVVKIDEKLGLTTPTYRTLPILRSDGTSLYATKDLALTRRKFERFGVDRAIWVVDVRQSLYFAQIAKILELAGFEQAKAAQHVGYEMVRLPEGVISSRKGNVPVYDDIRDAVVVRAREIIEEKNPELPPAQRAEVAWQVAIGSLKYAMLARDNNKVVVFDLDEALSFDGHAAPYIQYAHARACRILEHAEASAATLLPLVADLNFGDLAPEELSLLQHIASLPDEIQRAAAEYRPLLIASYVFELAQKFNDFYHACPVLPSPEPLRTARLALVAATQQTLARSLGLLGIAAPREM